MKNMKKRIITVLLTMIIFPLFMNFDLNAALQDEKQAEFDELKERLEAAERRIKDSATVKWADFLKLLPSVGVSRQATQSEIQEKENHYSASINSGQIFDINNIQNDREATKRKARRRVESCGYKIKKLIEKKYLILDKRWKLTQIKKSLEDPIEVTKMDDRIDEYTLNIKETEIEIEDTYAEIEYMCVEVEK
jgi:hypothetical protein